VSLGRRKIRVDDAAAWVFNKMADVYDARPPYPAALVDALAALAGGPGARIGDLGAGIGHLAIPLARRGFDVVAVEPAQAMLERLRATARDLGLPLRALHATAEALPIESAGLDLVVVADALHFLDRELASAEIARVLAPHGALAVLTTELAETRFMSAVTRIMEESAPRRPRALAQSIVQLSRVARVPLTTREFRDETPVDPGTLERIVRSISFIGPAMNPARFAAFLGRIHAIPEEPVWARSFTLHAGVRGDRSTSSRARRERARRPA
jgi:ubiquinone/menaquinone biosynthesis C-methylase UbiE